MLEKDILLERLNRIFKNWENNQLYADNTLSQAHCLVFIIGNNDETSNEISSAFATWLFGCIIHYTIIINKNAMHIVTTPEYISIFKPIKEIEEDSVLIDVHTVTDDNGIKEQFEILIGGIADEKKTIGIFGKNNRDTGLIESWKRLLDNRCNKLDISNVMAAIMSVKDLWEIDHTKNAGLMAQSAMVYLGQSLISIIGNGEEVSHHQLAEEVIDALTCCNSHSESSIN